MKRTGCFVISIALLAGLVGWRVMSKNSAEAAVKGGSSKGSRTPVVEVLPVKSGALVLAFSSTGTLESPNRVELTPRTSGQIVWMGPREGEKVAAGQVLVKMDSSIAKANLLAAESGVAETRARLAQAKLQSGSNSAQISGQLDQQLAAVATAKAEVEQARANAESQLSTAKSEVAAADSRVKTASAGVKTAEASLDREMATLANARSIFERQQSLFEKGFVSAQVFENARTSVTVQERQVAVFQSQVDSAKATLKAATAQLEASKVNLTALIRGSAATIRAVQSRLTQVQSSAKVAGANQIEKSAYLENLAALRAALNSAEAQVRQARNSLNEANIKSPVNGIVTTRSADSGALASASQPVLIVQSVDWLYFRSSLTSEESEKIALGSSAEVTFEGMEKPLIGVVSAVNAASDPTNRRVSLLIKIENPTARLRPGMVGKVLFVTSRVNATAIVPREALVTDAKGQTTVTVIGKDNKAEVRPVEVGLTDGKSVEIKNGLKPGETVVTMTYSRLKDGQEVKVPGSKKEPSK